MADRDPRLLLVLLHLCGVERGEVGMVGWARCWVLRARAQACCFQATMVVCSPVGGCGAGRFASSVGVGWWWLRITVNHREVFRWGAWDRP